MRRLQFRTRLLLILIASSWQSTAAAANLPTATEVLRIHQTNRERLSRLHLQLVYREETTEASCRRAQKQADEKEKFIAVVSQMTAADAALQYGEKKLQGEEALRLLQVMIPEMKEEVANLRSRSRPFAIVRPLEWFADGDDYQCRQPLLSTRTEELAAWSFPAAPLTAATLKTDYRDVSIFSRSAQMRPEARWWHRSAERHGYVMRKHLTDVSLVRLPPFMFAARPRWDMRHPIDAFFSQPADKYRVVREEELDGRKTVVVETSVPIDPPSTTRLAYRAWLDLQRGAIPLKMYQRQNSGDAAPIDQFDLWQPAEIVTTQQIRELPGGAFYPVKTVSETLQLDPDDPEPTAAEWLEVKAGKRKPPQVVERRNTWDCTLVELKSHFADGFFVVPFPAGQKLFDHDAGKIIGALDPKPPVQVGAKAPPLSIGLWLDGKQRSAEHFKGQVVVLDFWGLWCGACRSSVPRLKAMQESFRGKPVAFIGIHTAENDPAALAAQIREFTTKNDWNFLGAIDAGRMTDDSVTSNAFGVRSYPTLIVVGPDGEVVYAEPDLEGPACDETDPAVLAEFQKKFEAFMKRRFVAVGEAWPPAAGLDDERRMAIYERVETAYIKLQIETALRKAALEK